jgi:serine/threonine-protein kinase PpkA
VEELGYKILINIPGYEILRELGRGGMSTVYIAVQESLQRQLALKVMSPTFSVDPSFKDRFMREGRTLGQLTHPNIVIVYDIGLSANRYFIAMEYVGGGTLGELIQEEPPLTHSVRIIKAIARALHYAHRRGFVHRDVKPSNILFREDGTPVLADFGIARSVDANTRLTQTGLSVGTPNYMSPEQVAGQKLDGRSDLYSLGIVFYELLTGHRPYDGESAIATALRHLTEPVPTLPERLIFLQPLMERMLAKAPADRFKDEQEFIEALDKAIAASDSDKPSNEYAPLSGETLLSDENHHEQAKPASGQRRALEPKPSPKSESRTGAPNRLAAIERSSRWKLSAGFGIAGVLAAVAAILLFQPALDPATQRAVDHLLRMAERHVSNGQLIEPEGFNAYETYHDILEIAPDYQKALTGLHQIAGHFEAAARAKRKAGATEESLKLIAQGLKVEPEHEGLVELRDQITRQLENEKRRKKISTLLAKADRQFDDWRLVEPAGNNAAESYPAVLQLDSNNPRALQGLKRIADRLESLARTKQSGGDLKGALEDVKKGLRVDSQHQELQALQEEIKRQQKITTLLADATKQFKESKLFEPRGNNALASYQEVLALEPNNPKALEGLKAIADRQETVAKRAKDEGNLTEALAAIGQGRKAAPEHQGLKSLEAAVRSALQTEKERIERLRAQAEKQLAAGHFTSPAGNNAYESYRKLLAIEPDNEAAKRGIQTIVRTLEEQAREKQSAGALQKSLLLVEEARKLGAENPGLLPTSLGQELLEFRQALLDQIETLEVEQRIAALLDQAQMQLKDDKLTAPPGDNAEESYRKVLALDPRNGQAIAGKQRIVVRLVQLAQQRRYAGEFDESLALVGQGLKIAPEDETLLALKNDVEQRIKSRKEIAALFDKAEQQLGATRLMEPAGDNAYESYQQVLEREPGNKSALEGLKRIAERYLQFAQRQKQQGDLKAANALVRKGLLVLPDHAGLLAFRKALAKERTEREVATLMERAEQQLENDQLMEPAGNNAHETFRQVLSLKPNDPRALEGIERVAERFAVLAQERQRQGELSESLRLIRKGLTLAPNNRSLLTLQDHIKQQLEANQQREKQIAALLEKAERKLSEGHLTDPDGDNAYETFQQVLGFVPGNERALIGLHRLGDHLIKRAREELALGKHDEAEALVDQLHVVAPWHPRLADLKKLIAAKPEKKIPETALIAKRLAKAEQQIASLKLTRPRGDNAYETLQAVLAIDPDNRDAKAALSVIAERYAALARRQQQAGHTSDALAMVQRGLQIDPQHRKLLALKEKLTRAQKAPDANSSSLLAKAERQLAAGRTTGPPGDNAYQTLNEILRQQPGNRQAQAGLRTIAAQYEDSIKAQLNEGNFRKASELVEEGVRFFPEHKGLLALQGELAKRQEEQTVKSLLAKAERQMEAQQWTHPRGNNAFETLQEILRLVPNNRQAQQQLGSIPKRCEAHVRATQQNGNRASALSALEECLRFFPRNTELIALRDELLRPETGQPTPISAFEEVAPDKGRQAEGEERKPRRRRVFGTF